MDRFREIEHAATGCRNNIGRGCVKNFHAAGVLFFYARNPMCLFGGLLRAFDALYAFRQTGIELLQYHWSPADLSSAALVVAPFP